MRKILFKAKRVDNGEWVEGFYATFCETTIGYGNVHYIITFEHGMPKFHEVDPSTVCESIGLTDKNGREIFEGDIVRAEMETIGVVEYSDGAYVILYEKPIMTEWTGTLLFVEEPKELVVLGSIHDTPKRGPDDD